MGLPNGELVAYDRNGEIPPLNGDSENNNRQNLAKSDGSQHPVKVNDLFKDNFYIDSVERYNVKYRPKDQDS